MSLSGAAAALGIPEPLVQRSAAARAAVTGASVDEILAAWAGGEAVAAAAPAETAVAEPKPETVGEPEPEVTEETAPAAAAVIETPAAPAAPSAGAAPTRAPVPTEVTPAQAAHLPEVITVPTAGIRERTNFVIPRWLVALMLATPLLALFALGGASTGACGEATELTIDVITGQAVNCDGSEFTGGGAGGGSTDFVALGGDIYAGAGVSGVNCAGCHGGSGQGGVGPALGGVTGTFSACTDHIEWVRLGSPGFPDGHGDTNKPTLGGMPPFGGSLTDEQLASVVAFERVRFGGANPDETLADCGLVEADGEGAEGGEGEEGGAPAEEGDGGAPTGTTVPAEASAAGNG